MNDYLKAYMKQFRRAFEVSPVMKAEDSIPRLSMLGEVDIITFDPADEKNGKVSDNFVIEHKFIPNTVVDAGEIWIAELLAGEFTGDSTMSYGTGFMGWGVQYLQVGTTSSAPVFSNYNVNVSSVTNLAYVVTVNDIVVNNEVIYVATFGTANGNGVLVEAGLFSASSVPGSSTDTASRMLSRTTFAEINKTESISMAFQWTVKVGTLGS